MIIAFVSDIHGNLTAWEAVLRDMEAFRVDSVICLGDTVGYGPKPSECMDLMLRTCSGAVLGNHDALTAYPDISLRGLREDVADGILHARATLRDREIEALREMPLTLRIGDFICVHSSLQAPDEFPYVLTKREARAHFQTQTTPLSFFGHSHVPEGWLIEGRKIRKLPANHEEISLVEGPRYAFNVGSVGQPRDGDPRACYLLLNTLARTLRWRRVPYDIGETVRAMTALGMSNFACSRLLVGR